VKISIAKIKQAVGDFYEFEREEKVRNLTYQGAEINFLKLLSVKGMAINLGDDMFQVKGDIKSTAETLCHRCLCKTQVNIDNKFDLKFSSTGHESDDEDIIGFSGDEIELLPHIINEIILKWPSQVLCRPDCKGLCAHCGKNLNLGNCDCKDDNIDPRLAVLKELIKKD
jgi:uncharacterized protein